MKNLFLLLSLLFLNNGLNCMQVAKQVAKNSTLFSTIFAAQFVIGWVTLKRLNILEAKLSKLPTAEREAETIRIKRAIKYQALDQH